LGEFPNFQFTPKNDKTSIKVPEMSDHSSSVQSGQWQTPKIMQRMFRFGGYQRGSWSISSLVDQSSGSLEYTAYSRLFQGEPTD
jgi:hypothetical protein